MREGNTADDHGTAKKVKVLIVHNYYQIPGGEDTVVANEKKLLEEHGHEVILYTRSNCELKEMGKGRRLLLVISMAFNPRTYREVRRIILEQNIDIVQVHNTLHLISPAVYYAALSRKTPVVQTVHNFRLLCPGATFYRDGRICEDCVEHGLGCALKHSCYRDSRLQTLACVISTRIHRMTGVYGKLHYICLTEFNKEKLLSLRQIRPEKVYIKPNFTYPVAASDNSHMGENAYKKPDGEYEPTKNHDLLKPDDAGTMGSGSGVAADYPGAGVEGASYANGKTQFAYVGRLDPLKGIQILCEAWRHLEERGHDYALLVCGTGPMEAWCREYIEENGLRSIRLLGQVPNQEAREIIAASTALILPTQWYEGFPMTLAEAYSVGTPSIVSDLGNAGSLVEEGVTGFKFQHDSYEALSAAIEKMAVSDTRVMKENVRNRYQAEFSPEANYRRLISIYDTILEG